MSNWMVINAGPLINAGYYKPLKEIDAWAFNMAHTLCVSEMNGALNKCHRRAKVNKRCCVLSRKLVTINECMT